MVIDKVIKLDGNDKVDSRPFFSKGRKFRFVAPSKQSSRPRTCWSLNSTTILTYVEARFRSI